MKTAARFGAIALAALVLTVLPGGGSALDVVLTFLTIAFFAAIGVLGYRLFMQYRDQLDALESSQRLVLYGSVGLAFLTFTATARLFGQGGAGVVVWLALLALCSYGVFWVWTRSQRYS